jgi:hypothetical protein
MSRAGGSLAPTLSRVDLNAGRRRATAKPASAGTESAGISVRDCALANETLVAHLARAPARDLKRKREDVPTLLTLPDRSDERRRVAAQHRLRHLYDAGPGVLNRHSVGPKTQVRYRLALQEIVTHLRETTADANASLEQCPRLDELVRDFIERSFWSGRPASEATATIAAVGWLLPQYSRHGQERLPLARQAAAGFMRLDPARTRLPLPAVVVAALANELVLMGEMAAARAVSLAMMAYLRPGEVVSLRWRQLVPPEPIAGNDCASLLMHPFEAGKSSKTGSYDDTVPLDLPEQQHLATALLALKKTRSPDDLMFDLSLNDLGRLFRTASLRLKLEALGPPVLYQLRHAGPSHDLARRLRSLAEVKKRGRWRSDASVARYAKGGRLGEQVQRLPARMVRHCQRCADGLHEILSGRSPPCRP